jgi:hypothetical protein
MLPLPLVHHVGDHLENLQQHKNPIENHRSNTQRFVLGVEDIRENQQNIEAIENHSSKDDIRFGLLPLFPGYYWNFYQPTT